MAGFGSSDKDSLLDNGYNSYETGYDGQNQGNSSIEETFKLDALRDDYKADGEFIRQTIADSLKKNDLRTAQEFVEKYAPVAMDDVKFRTLADMTRQSANNLDNLAVLETKLSATPENDFRARYEILKQILKYAPDNEDYKKAFEACSKKIEKIENNEKNNEPEFLRKHPFMTVGAAIVSIFYVLFFIGMFITDDVNVYVGLASAAAFFFMTNLKLNPIRKFPTLAKIGLVFLGWFIMFGIFYEM